MAYGKIKADAIIYDDSGSDVEKTIASLASAAPTASPTFTGTVTVPTASANDNTTKAASTAYVQTELGDYATLAAPALTGDATAVNLTLSGNLIVNGTTTTINSTTLAVDDKNIELGSVDTPSDTTADGGGITLKGATDKTITWIDSTDSWTFNQSVTVTGGQIKIEGIEGGASQILMYADEGDDNADKWKIASNTNGTFSLANYSSGGWSTGYLIDGSNNSTFYGSISDSKGDLRNIPQNYKTSAYTLAASDAGKHIYYSGSAAAITVPSGEFSVGDAITIISANSSASITIEQSGTTIHNAADQATGTRTLAPKGMATLICVASNVFSISGAGLS